RAPAACASPPPPPRARPPPRPDGREGLPEGGVFVFLPLLPSGRGGGGEKRFGVMRANLPGARTPSHQAVRPPENKTGGSLAASSRPGGAGGAGSARPWR